MMTTRSHSSPLFPQWLCLLVLSLWPCHAWAEGIVRVSADRDEARVYAGTELLGSLPQAGKAEEFWLRDGPHTIRFRLEGFADDVHTVRVIRDQSVEVQGVFASTGELVVTSSPAGRPVFLGGEPSPRGDTPITLVDLPAGELRVEVAHELGRQTQSLEIPRGASLTSHFDLTPRPVLIVSEPTGAAVGIGPRRLGTTPLSTELPDGRYALELRKEGFLPRTCGVSVNGEPFSVRAALFPDHPPLATAAGLNLRLAPTRELPAHLKLNETEPVETYRDATWVEQNLVWAAMLSGLVGGAYGAREVDALADNAHFVGIGAMILAPLVAAKIMNLDYSDPSDWKVRDVLEQPSARAMAENEGRWREYNAEALAQHKAVQAQVELENQRLEANWRAAAAADSCTFRKGPIPINSIRKDPS